MLKLGRSLNPHEWEAMDGESINYCGWLAVSNMVYIYTHNTYIYIYIHTWYVYFDHRYWMMIPTWWISNGLKPPDTGDPVVTVRNHGGIFRIDVDPVDGALFILHGSTVSQWGPPPKFRCDHLLAKKEGPPRGSGGSGGSGWLWAPPVSENEGLGTGQFKRAHSCQFLNLKSEIFQMYLIHNRKK